MIQQTRERSPSRRSALSLAEQGRRNVENLVDSTELILQAEVSGWGRETKDTGETRPETH